MSDRSYYCSIKFRFLKLDIESNQSYNCHAAKPHEIDFAWLANNPSQLFNTEINVNERKMMLLNQRNESCGQNCWPAEDSGCVSPRQWQSGEAKTSTNVIGFPEIVDLTVGGDCNLTCSYCCKEFSSSWRNDILTNGDYVIDELPDRYNISDKDNKKHITSQADTWKNSNTKLIHRELQLWGNSVKHLVISGGEPLLYKFLPDILESAQGTENVYVYTGLGVSDKILEKRLALLSEYTNVSLVISVESTGKYLEFNRYGIISDNFDNMMKLIKHSKVPFLFQSTISNLSVFGFTEFYNKYWNEVTSKTPSMITMSHQPSFMAPYVLDDTSKDLIIKGLQSLPPEISMNIIQSMQATPTELQRVQLRQFLTQFTERRKDLSLDIFPDSFLEWIRKT